MGQLLSNFKSEASIPDFGFDIENTTPSNEDRELYEEIHTKLVAPTPQLLEQLKNYTPSDAFKIAIENATPENEEKAWQMVLPTVEMLNAFYQYASELQVSLPKLLSVLCKDNHFDQHPGLTKLLAEILDFVFDFDYWKIRTPTLLNNFAYYRRLLAGGRYHPSPITVKTNDHNVSDLRSAMQEDDQAHKITMFLAPPTPMFTTVIDTITNYVNKQGLQRSVTDCLVALWAACVQGLSNKKKPLDDPTTSTYLKSMVASIILYDHIDSQGAYSKQSCINMKTSIKLIQTTPDLPEESSAENLLSALRYNSKHLKDDTTPKSIKFLLLSS
ncbi:uncharacterized protein BX664DRAFT_328163 [Halteromyces radiatus]|uniref:uncharacterized protein n=1 Tax=Halteromyces radiatus TaxID=101107 RepID=UPI00221EC7D2|nr:uncharacterized protein BX664DRAFT_328163 [Halteromyces radiatus]KAI8092793.1 hypothetical protein BX664DRAFT_328163 [Halteromyces radiatus]